MEGHIVLLMNNSPTSIITPVTFWSLFHAGEDQYLRWPEGNFLRVLRLLAIFVALFTPSIYVAVSNFHVEMLPTDLMLAIAATRERVPFSSILEVIFMEITFEILRESAVRVPSVVGPSIGIVGTLILGTAAVDANLVSPILVVIVAITGLSSFTIPGVSLNFAVRLLRFCMLLSAVMIGFYGIALFLAFLLAYLVSLKSFGVPFLSPMAPHQPSSKDMILRPPSWKQWLRPFSVSPKDKVRTKKPEGNN
jgi:spore germination protein KA